MARTAPAPRRSPRSPYRTGGGARGDPQRSAEQHRGAERSPEPEARAGHRGSDQRRTRTTTRRDQPAHARGVPQRPARSAPLTHCVHTTQSGTVWSTAVSGAVPTRTGSSSDQCPRPERVWHETTGDNRTRHTSHRAGVHTGLGDCRLRGTPKGEAHPVSGVPWYCGQLVGRCGLHARTRTHLDEQTGWAFTDRKSSRHQLVLGARTLRVWRRPCTQRCRPLLGAPPPALRRLPSEG